MPQPGWYADPDGTPQRLRWWDGTRWTEHVHGTPRGPEVPGRDPRGGPWPWVALALVAALSGAVVFGFATGMFGRGSPLGSPATPSRSAPPPASPTPSLPALPTATPEPPSARPTLTPTPWPSLPSQSPTPQDLGCPPPASDGSLSDGYLRVNVPPTWPPAEDSGWLSCTQSAAAPDASASVTLGRSEFAGADLRAAAEEAWAIALLDAAVPVPRTQTSTPVTVAGLDGWMVAGTVGLQGELAELTVLVVDAGHEPSVVVTHADLGDPEAHTTVARVLASLREA